MYCAPMYALMRILPGVNIKTKKKKGETLARTGHGWFQRVSRSRMCSTMSTITWDICASRSDLAVTRDVVIVTVLAAGVLFCKPRGLK